MNHDATVEYNCKGTGIFSSSVTQRDIAMIKIVSVKCRFCVRPARHKPPDHDTIKGRRCEIRPDSATKGYLSWSHMILNAISVCLCCFKERNSKSQHVKLTFFKFAESALTVCLFVCFLVTPYRSPIIVATCRWTGRKWRRT